MSTTTQQKYKEAGLCIKCGKMSPGPKSINYCESCRKRTNTRQRHKKDEWIAAGLCGHCGKNPLAHKRHCAKCYEEHQASARKNYLILRDEVFAAYGGYICACCGEPEKAFLTIDHIDGGGNKHRKEVGQSNVYRWLKQHDYPPGFQVLCMNCQWGKRNCGICPHQSKNVKLFVEGRKEVRQRKLDPAILLPL